MTVTTINLAAEFDAITAVIVAGHEAGYYVRGAMDPAFTDPQARDRYAKHLARFAPTYAASFLRGWASHRKDERAPYVRHFMIGSTAVEVSVG